MKAMSEAVDRLDNTFDAAGRALMLQSPDIGPPSLKDAGAEIHSGGPPDKAALLAVMSRQGLVLAAPGGA